MAKASKFTLDAEADVASLKGRSLRSATLVASLYLQTRLTTLIMRGLGIESIERRRKFKRMFDDLTLGLLVSLACEAGMVTREENALLNKFVELRNDIAHDLEMWDALPEKTRVVMEDWCDFVIRFMELTDDRAREVERRETTKSDHPGWLNQQWVDRLEEFLQV